MTTPEYEDFEKWADTHKSGVAYTLKSNKSYYEVWQAALSAAPTPPSPKPEWDAEGNPLNLGAAARVAYFAIKVEHGYEHPACVHLRKFLQNES